MNNKPVAWMMVNRENTSAYLTFEKPTRDMKISHEPHELYTHPVKELTDEEIEEVMTQAGYGEVHKFVNPFDFAKAILRKAQSACNGFCGEYECKENQAGCKRKAQEK